MWLLLVMLCTAQSVTALAADGDHAPAVIRIQSADGDARGTLRVAVTIENNPGISGFCFTFSYPTDALELLDMEGGPLLEGRGEPPLCNTEAATALWYSVAALPGDGVLLYLTFGLPDCIAYTQYPVSCVLTDGNAQNFLGADAKPAEVSFADGEIGCRSRQTVTAVAVCEGEKLRLRVLDAPREEICVIVGCYCGARQTGLRLLCMGPDMGETELALPDGDTVKLFFLRADGYAPLSAGIALKRSE